MNLYRLLLNAFAFSVIMLIHASVASAQAPQGTYVLRGPNGPSADVTVSYTVTGTQNPKVNITVSRGNGANLQSRYYRGLKNYPAMDLYNSKSADNGGAFVLSINAAAVGGTLVSVPNYSFYSEEATSATYQYPALQTAIDTLKQDEPVLVALERAGVFDIGYIAAGNGHATNDYARAITTSVQWQIISGPTIGPPTANNLGGCVWWCEFWSWDCSDGERACVAKCESDNSGVAVDWRNKCGLRGRG